MDRKQAEVLLVEKAQRDEFFRQRLIDDPAGTIASELGVTIPARVKLNVLEETDTNLYLVLPAHEARTLREAELAAVVGGAQQATVQGAATGTSNFFDKIAGGSTNTTDKSPS